MVSKITVVDGYDYGARMYDPALGRFTTVDTLAEKYSFQLTFCSAANNPIKFIDWKGMGPGGPEKPENSVSETTTLTGILEKVLDAVSLNIQGTNSSSSETLKDG